MRRPILAAMLALSYVIVFVLTVSAQQGTGHMGGSRGQRGGGQPIYDPSKAETVSGQVIAVKDIEVKSGKITGVSLELNTGSQTLHVYLGPHIYVDFEHIKIVAGDMVDIKGVRSVVSGQDVFLAGEVRRGNEVLKLRNEDGVPLWVSTR
jgi:hypothetical protein